MHSTRKAASVLLVTSLAAVFAACDNDLVAPRASPSPAGAPNAAVTGAVTGPVSTQLDAGQCLDVSGARKDNGAPVVLGACQNGSSQRFTWSAAGELRVQDGAKCLGPVSGRTSDGDAVTISTCHGGAGQRWSLTSAGELVNGDGKCLDLWNSATANGTRVVIHTCNGGRNQQWNAPSPATAAPAPAEPVADPAPTPAPAPAPAPTPAPSQGMLRGMWITKAELDALPMSGSGWTGTGELKATADAPWTVQPIELQSGQVFNVQVMAGALVYARLAPDASAAPYRAKVAQAIREVIAQPIGATSVTAPSRNLGAFAIAADLINLPAYDPALDASFRAWLTSRLDHHYSSSPASIRLAAKQRPNNIGSWSRFSLAAASAYLGDRAELDRLAHVLRAWLGVKPIADPFVGVAGGWGAGAPNYSNTWQENPLDRNSWRGIVRKGVVRDGHSFDGLQPEDHWRGITGAYVVGTFPGRADHRYPEESLAGVLGAVLIMHRMGYTDLVPAADAAMLRAAKRIKFLADTYPSLGYFYFTDALEASRPLITYFYPYAGMPGARVRNQLAGRAKGFAWTYWTHGGRGL